MKPNRSMLDGPVIPVLTYPDVDAAVEWLAALGFRERVRIGAHRSQLTLGSGSLVVAHGEPAPGSTSIMLRVANAGPDAVDYPFGERQRTVVDPWGYRWTLSETVADVDPESWGGTPIT
jgi:hypothetical protein